MKTLKDLKITEWNNVYFLFKEEEVITRMCPSLGEPNPERAIIIYQNPWGEEDGVCLTPEDFCWKDPKYLNYDFRVKSLDEEVIINRYYTDNKLTEYLDKLIGQTWLKLNFAEKELENLGFLVDNVFYMAKDGSIPTSMLKAFSFERNMIMPIEKDDGRFYVDDYCIEYAPDAVWEALQNI